MQVRIPDSLLFVDHASVLLVIFLLDQHLFFQWTRKQVHKNGCNQYTGGANFPHKPIQHWHSYPQDHKTVLLWDHHRKTTKYNIMATYLQLWYRLHHHGSWCSGRDYWYCHYRSRALSCSGNQCSQYKAASVTTSSTLQLLLISLTAHSGLYYKILAPPSSVLAYYITLSRS